MPRAPAAQARSPRRPPLGPRGPSSRAAGRGPPSGPSQGRARPAGRGPDPGPRAHLDRQVAEQRVLHDHGETLLEHVHRLRVRQRLLFVLLVLRRLGPRGRLRLRPRPGRLQVASPRARSTRTAAARPGSDSEGAGLPQGPMRSSRGASCRACRGAKSARPLAGRGERGGCPDQWALETGPATAAGAGAAGSLRGAGGRHAALLSRLRERADCGGGAALPSFRLQHLPLRAQHHPQGAARGPPSPVLALAAASRRLRVLPRVPSRAPAIRPPSLSAAPRVPGHLSRAALLTAPRGSPSGSRLVPPRPSPPGLRPPRALPAPASPFPGLAAPTRAPSPCLPLPLPLPRARGLHARSRPRPETSPFPARSPGHQPGPTRVPPMPGLMHALSRDPRRPARSPVAHAAAVGPLHVLSARSAFPGAPCPSGACFKWLLRLQRFDVFPVLLRDPYS